MIRLSNFIFKCFGTLATSIYIKVEISELLNERHPGVFQTITLPLLGVLD